MFDDNECYPSGIETPYWIIAVGFITSLFVNSFILFSGQSLTTKIWNTLKNWICRYLCCCLSSNDGNSNPPPIETRLDVNHVSVCVWWCCCHWISYLFCCCRKSEKEPQVIKFPKIIKLSVNKNIDEPIDISINVDTDEYDEEFEASMIGNRATTIDISVQEMLLNDDASSPLIKKHDVSLTGSEISGYYKLLNNKEDIKKYGYPVYRSNHASLNGDYLLLYYIGDDNIGWGLSYSSLYGFRNEMYQSIIFNINSNLLNQNSDIIKYIHLKQHDKDHCIWKLCQLDSFQNMNPNESHIICYDFDDNPLNSMNDSNDIDLIFNNSVKLQFRQFAKIENNLMERIDLNGMYHLISNNDQEIEIKKSFDSNNSDRFPKIEMKNDNHSNYRHNLSIQHNSHRSLSSLMSRQSTNSLSKRMHHKLKHKNKILIFQHATNKDLQLFLPRKSFKRMRKKRMGMILPRAAIFHIRLQQFIAYIPINQYEDDNNINDIFDGYNWRMIEWNWKNINNLSISISSAVLSFYLAQLLSIWIFIIGLYQWYIDIESFIKYLNKYGDKYSIWRQYECYGLIITNTPNMKQLILIVGLIIWSNRINAKSNYQIYLQKQTYLQLVLLFGYLILILFAIPIIFTHFIPLFIPIAIFLWLISFCFVTFTHKHLSTQSIHERHQKVLQKFDKLNDVTTTDKGINGCHFSVMISFILWKFACIYFVVILCVPVLSRVYSGNYNLFHAFQTVYNSRHTLIYFQNVKSGYVLDLDRVRLLLYWLL